MTQTDKPWTRGANREFIKLILENELLFGTDHKSDGKSCQTGLKNIKKKRNLSFLFLFILRQFFVIVYLYELTLSYVSVCIHCAS